MSSSTSSRLPAVGTTFSSLLNFKISAFNAAKNGLFSMRVFNSVSNRSAKLTCTGLGSRSFLVRNGLEPCTCHIRAYRDGKGGFEVKEVDDRHTCSLAQPGSKQARRAQKDMAARIAALEKEAESSSEDSEGEEEENSGGDSEADDEEEANESATSLAASPPRHGQAVEEQRRGKRELGHEQQKETDRKGFPTKRSLADVVDSLAKRVRLDLPDPQQVFPDASSILIHLYAWGEQNNILLTHMSSSSTRTLVSCKPLYDVVRCTFGFEVNQTDDGGWTASLLNDKHDQSIHDKAVERGMNRPIPKIQAVLPSFSPSSGKKHLQTAPAPSSSSPTLPSSPNKHASAPAHLRPTLLNVQSDNTLSLDRLTSFFASLSPSTSTADISVVSTALLSSGISSISDLSALVQFAVGTLLTFVEEIKGREGWSVEEATSLVRLLDVAQKAFEGEK